MINFRILFSQKIILESPHLPSEIAKILTVHLYNHNTLEEQGYRSPFTGFVSNKQFSLQSIILANNLLQNRLLIPQLNGKIKQQGPTSYVFLTISPPWFSVVISLAFLFINILIYPETNLDSKWLLGFPLFILVLLVSLYYYLTYSTLNKLVKVLEARFLYPK